jgi:hypothetical protein
MKKFFITALVGAFVFAVMGTAGAVMVSFVSPLSGVDNTLGWSTGDGTVTLGTSFTILSGNGTVYGYYGVEPWNLTQRGTRGLGVVEGENDEIDSQELASSEMIKILFNGPQTIRYLEVRSLFTSDAGWGGTEQGAVDFYRNGILLYTQDLTGVESGGNGVLALTPYATVDELRFYVPAGLPANVRSNSEFALAKLNAVIPEPSSMLLLGMGILGLFGLRRKT